jgi:hypothetical protein
MIHDRIEGFLINLSLSFEEVDTNIWHIDDEDKGLGHIMVVAEESLVTFRVKVMELPGRNREELLELLLRLNLDIVHGAYALEDNNIVIIDTMETGTLDYEVFQTTLDSIGLTLAEHYPQLQTYRAS